MNMSLQYPTAVFGKSYIYPRPPFSSMTDPQTSFWTPARIGVVIGAVLLIMALAYAASLPVEGTFNVIGTFDRRKAHL